MATEKKENILPNLPPEIIEKILLKLPVKSLLKCRAVSKSWNCLITDPKFCQIHLQSSNPSNLFLHNSRYNPPGAFSFVKLEGPEFRVESIYEGSYGWNYVAFILGGVSFRQEGGASCTKESVKSSVIGGPYGWDKVLGNCNGVLLLADSSPRPSSFALWNPSTRMVTHLSFGSSNFYDHINYGICYDALVDDFKVVVTAGKNYEVYSCNSRSYTAKVGFPYQGTDSGISVDGAVYWVWSDKKNIRHVVYFDPRIDKLKRLQKPRQLADDVLVFLACLGGSLCLYCNAAGDVTKVRIWIKEKGVVKNCWKELITIENVQTSIWSFKPVCFVEDKIMIGLDGGRIVFYNPSDKTYEECVNIDVFSDELVPYSDSLFFPGIKMLPRRMGTYVIH